MKRNVFVFLCFLICLSGSSQVIPLYNTTTSYNYESEALEGKETNLVLAFSMRKLFIDFEGPLVRLRRAGDNATKDFYVAAVSNIVDVDAIDEWRGVNSVFVETWYNQDGTSNHASQSNINLQPQFNTDPDIPHFYGDGVDDRLVINLLTKSQLTNDGAEATIILVTKATTDGQYNFGAQNPSNGNDRWATHLNWTNNWGYLDLGRCCSQTRAFSNSVNVNVWKSYSIVRAPTFVTADINGVNVFSTTYASTSRFTDSAATFHLLNASGGGDTLSSTSSISEFIMYNTNISTTIYDAISTDQILFWKIN